MTHLTQATQGTSRSRRDILKLGLAASSSGMLGLAPGMASAQSDSTWPTKVIRIVCAQATGSSNDTTGRVLGEFITAKLGVPVIIENRPGAVGTIAGDNVVRSPADGYTLLFTLHSQLAQAPVLLKKVPYDPFTDLIPIGAYGTGSSPAVVRNGLPVKSMRELVEYAKKTSVTVGNYGIGSGWQLMLTQLIKDTGAQFTIVNYRGTGPMTLDLMAGNIDVGAGSLAGLAAGIESGKFRAIHLIGGSSKNKALPNLLTWEEAGYTAPAYTALKETNMLLAPKGTPQGIINKLSEVIDASAVESERMKAVLAQLGETGKPWTGEALTANIKKIWPTYQQLTRELNLQVG